MSDTYTPTTAEVTEWVTDMLCYRLSFGDAEVAVATWLARHDAEVAAKAIEAFAATLGVSVGDEDDEWWRGYRQGQRRALHGAVEFAAEYRKEAGDE